MQTRERSADVAPRPSPEEFCGRRGARPDSVVEVRRARLLCPEKVLPAEDELRLVGGEVRKIEKCLRELQKRGDE